MLRAPLQRFADSQGRGATVATGDGSATSPGIAMPTDTIERPPVVSPLPSLAERPFWSVMIPIYNCREDYLRETLGSVLCQDPGPADMQIEVLDNCSTVGDPEGLVREIGGGRIVFHRQTHNLGIAGNFNACIDRARGHWVHILHSDDTVRPEFYNRARLGIASHPEVGAALSRVIYIDGDGRWIGLSELESRTPGVLDDSFTWRQLVDQRIQFVGMIVRRSTYEELGGFRPSLPHCLDWDMWKRVAISKAIVYDPEPLACYRLHDGMESSRLIMTGANVAEERRSIEYTCALLPLEQAASVRQAAKKFVGIKAARRARQLWRNGLRYAAWRQLAEAVRCSRAPSVLARSLFALLVH